MPQIKNYIFTNEKTMSIIRDIISNEKKTGDGAY